MEISNLCTPSLIYFVISIIYLIINSFKKFNVMFIIFNIIIIVVWSLFLNFLCSMGYSAISWLILILPFLFIYVKL